jgi:hypothetical protein
MFTAFNVIATVRAAVNDFGARVPLLRPRAQSCGFATSAPGWRISGWAMKM